VLDGGLMVARGGLRGTTHTAHAHCEDLHSVVPLHACLNMCITNSRREVELSSDARVWLWHARKRADGYIHSP